MRTSIEKLSTGIEGFDFVSRGGLPKGRTTLVAGTAGSGKTVFAAQFLAEGVRRGEKGVFVTFEESPEDIRRNMGGFGWPIAQWEADGSWVFVDAAPQPDEERIEAGTYDFGALQVRVETAVRRHGATRISLDSIGAVFSQFQDVALVRGELHRISSALRKLGVTAVMTAERPSDHGGEVSRHGVEEFVADNVILLRNVLELEKRRRTLEILKFRGTEHQKGEYPFSVMPQSAISVIPLSAAALNQRSSTTRISTGNVDLDAMCGGGVFRDSIILVSGATGTGKTLLGTVFTSAGVIAGERCLLFAFEESREQLQRNAAGWGVDLEKLERDGLLKIVCEYPEVVPIEDHLIRMKNLIDEFKPKRLLVDSMTALERIATVKSFREFVIGLTSFVKEHSLACMLTSTTPTLMGGASVTEAHISSITDTIILLRYVELFGEMRRGVTVLKMRGSRHEKNIREFLIEDRGMAIGRPFRNVTGILSGSPQQLNVAPEEVERLRELFTE